MTVPGPQQSSPVADDRRARQHRAADVSRSSWTATWRASPQYQRRGGRIIFVHTQIDAAYEGQGLASTLARAALDAAREAGEPVIPLCPFIAAYIERHEEYADLVDRDLLERLGD